MEYDSGGMPKSNNLNYAVIVIQAIDNSIFSHDEFSNGVIIKFWYNAASLRELGQTSGMIN
jgi:hypothetical protein